MTGHVWQPGREAKQGEIKADVCEEYPSGSEGEDTGTARNMD